MKSLLIPKPAITIMTTLRDHGFECYLVGGAIRDYLLGLEPKDYDLCTSANEEEIRSCFPGATFICDNGAKHGTLTIRMGETNTEVSTFRNQEGTKPSLETDLRHRDLTINSIAYDGEKFIDPCGGIGDIKNKTLTLGDNPSQAIIEDPLRILRVLRFKANLGFRIEEKTAAAIKESAKLLKNVAKERILVELRGILIDENILATLLDYQEIFLVLFPDLVPTVGFDQHTRWHAHKLYEHIAHVVAGVPADFMLRFAALLHDNGKVRCVSQEDKPDGSFVYHFPGHPQESALMAKPVLKEYRLPLKEAEEILFLIAHHDYVIAPKPKSVRKFLALAYGVCPEDPLSLLDKLLRLQESDHADHTILVPIPRAEILDIAKAIIDGKEAFSLKDLAIRGEDLLVLGYQGKIIGIALRSALDEVIAERIPNEKEPLLQFISSRF